MLKRIAGIALIAAGLVACGGDDEGTGPDPDDELVGTWVSKGADVATGLAASPFFTDSIIATFNDDNTYTVLQYYGGQGTPITLTGSYQLGTGAVGTIRSIQANQTQGSVTSNGIFQVTGTRLKYEIIQTSPALAGVNPPTVAGGFGSTTVGGVATGDYWVQEYSKR